jgi:trimeric autotransporter adhesin
LRPCGNTGFPDRDLPCAPVSHPPVSTPFPGATRAREGSKRNGARVLRRLLPAVALALVVALWAAAPAFAQEAQENTASGEATSDNGSAASQDSGQTQEVVAEPAPEPSATPDAAPAQETSTSSEAGTTQEAGAAADSSQTDVGNSNTSVAVETPTETGGVAQENSSGADAGASTTSNGETTGGAQADANATQNGATNTNVEVRVDSPGGTGPVSQVNTVDASAAGDIATATAAGADVGNVNVSIRIDSPGDNGEVTQLNQAAAEIAALADMVGVGETLGTATLDGAYNTNVSIRIASPGEDGLVTQWSGATLSGDAIGEDWLAVTTDATNTNVAIDLAEWLTGLSIPTNWTWTWNWVWDGTQELNAETIWQALQADLASWQWSWQWSEAEALPSASAATVAQQPGSWNWSWAWDQADVPAWSWDWIWSAFAPCAECTWNWSWNWSWTNLAQAETLAEPPVPVENFTLTALADGEGLTVGQLNAAYAAALAAAESEYTQGLAQEQSGASQQTSDAVQVIDVNQLALADAFAAQADAWNVNAVLPFVATYDGMQGGSVTQANVASASATAIASSSVNQDIAQGASGDGAEQTQWAGQNAGVDQVAGAQAGATQTSVANVNASYGSEIGQLNGVYAEATAVTTSEISQGIEQYAGGGTGALQSQQAGQLTEVGQMHGAFATASQTEAYNWNLSAGGSFQQTNSVQAHVWSSAASTVSQQASQEMYGGVGGILQFQESWQLVTISQTGVASVSASHSNVENSNVYFEPPPGSVSHPGLSPGIVPFAVPSAVAPISVFAIGSLFGGLPDGKPLSGSSAPPGSLDTGAGGIAISQVSVSSVGQAGALAAHESSAGGPTATDTEPGGSVAALLQAHAPVDSGAFAGGFAGAVAAGAVAALVALLLLAVPGLGRRLVSPVVRRPAVVLALETSPG